ncbi:MAG: MoaD/ThiS family protein [Nocardioidaceae bacterium]
MSVSPGGSPTDQTAQGAASERAGSVTVRYWASARAAATVDQDVLEVDGPVTLADVTATVVAAHPGTRLAQVLGVCSVLVGDRPVGRTDPADVVVAPGDHVEFLPPFAGG